MVRVDSAGRIAEIIRRQIELLQSRRAPPGEAAGGRRTAAADARQNTALGPQEVAARRIRAIDPADPQRRRRAFRLFLESVLLAELGPSLINDAGFQQLVDQVEQSMAADPELARAMDAAGAQLLDPDAI